MLLVNADASINLCYNSQLTGSGATTSPCGFSVAHPSTGVYEITFPYQINSRFFSATLAIEPNGGFAADDIGTRPISSQTIRVRTVQISPSPALVDNTFYLIVY